MTVGYTNIEQAQAVLDSVCASPVINLYDWQKEAFQYISNYITENEKKKRPTSYLDLLDKLARVREDNKGKESPEEDKLLDEMDALWLGLTDKERAEAQALPSRTAVSNYRPARRCESPGTDSAKVEAFKPGVCRGTGHGSCKGNTDCDQNNVCFSPS